MPAPRKKKTPKKKTPPKSVSSYKGRGRPPMAVSLTSRLREVLAMKANRVEMAKEYAEAADLDPKTATVLDCLVHCQLYWAFQGSSPHMEQVWNRMEGRTPIKAELSVDGKLGISEAIAAMEMGKEGEEG